VLDRTHYTGILSYEPRFKSDIPRLRGQPHADPARPVVAITHPLNGSTVVPGSVLHLELILLNIMEGEFLLQAAVDGDRQEELGMPNLHSRNIMSVRAPWPPSGWFEVEISLVSAIFAACHFHCIPPIFVVISCRLIALSVENQAWR